jgi:trehalose 6-phosphate phosphatase
MSNDAPGDVLAQARAHPGETLVALDFDGTLAPIVDRPEDAYAHPDAANVLADLGAAGFRLAIVTGRPVADVLRLGAGFDAIPGLLICGHYGLEGWADGELSAPDEHPAIAAARSAVREVVDAAPAGVSIEDKGRSVAVHTRTAADPAATVADLESRLNAIAAAHDLEVVPGRFVLELRPAGVDKGAALRDLVAELGAGVVVFAGDDLGDLPAVAALRSTDVAAFVVCSDSPEAPAELRDAADLIVDGPVGVLAFLRAMLPLHR